MQKLILLSILTVVFCDVVHLPLIRIKSMREKMEEDGTWQDYVKARRAKKLATFGSPSEKDKTPESLAKRRLPTRDYSELIYVGLAGVGTPPQNFTILPDTGSTDLWVPDITCGSSILPPGCDPWCPWVRKNHDNYCTQVCTARCCPAINDACDAKRKFNSSISSTYVPNGKEWSIFYGTGSSSGFLGQDDVTFGGIVADNQIFAQANSIAEFFKNQPLDGILGLAWQAIAEDHAPSVVRTMVNQGKLDQPRFSIWMTHTKTPGEVGGEVTIGGTNPDRYTGTIDYVPLTSDTFWQYTLDKVSCGSYSKTQSWQAITDSGTSFMLVPDEVMDGIATVFGVSYDPLTGDYHVPCNITGLPDVVLTINGKTYAVTQHSYVIGRIDGGDTCAIAIDGIGFTFGGPEWILGTTFIREFYSIFDIGGQQFGLAQSKYN